MKFHGSATVYSVENKHITGCDFPIAEFEPKQQKGQTLREVAFDMAMRSAKRKVLKEEDWEGLTIEGIYIRLYDDTPEPVEEPEPVAQVKGQQSLFG